MRPKKPILLIGNELTLSPIKFMLNLDWRYRATITQTATEAIDAITNADKRYELVVLLVPFLGAYQLLEDVHKIDRRLLTLVMCPKLNPYTYLHASQFISSPSSEELFERIATMTTSQRGPRKGSPGAILCGIAAKARATRKMAA
jgi:hypothetical protein